MTINQARGYLYEILITHLLEQNHFLRCKQDNQVNKNYKCGISTKDGEVLGRGTHHQIDFVGIYSKNIPFVYPIRLLAECKFWTETKDNEIVYKPVSKSFIREYIGVYKDISENYFSLHMKNFTRFLDVPIIFSAGGFNLEAEKLAWAHGINIVSHSKIPIMSDILNFINSLVDAIPQVFFTDKQKFKVIKRSIEKVIRENLSNKYTGLIKALISHLQKSTPDYENIVELLANLLERVRNLEYNTFLFATTEYGKLINLISYEEFPDDLFSQSESQDCGIFFDDTINTDDNNANDRVFYITLNEDTNQRKFYFQASNEMLLEGFSRRSLEERIDTKEKYFKKLSIIKEINGLTRLITINVNFENIINRIN